MWLALLALAWPALPLAALAGSPELDVAATAIKGKHKVAIAEFGVEFFTKLLVGDAGIFTAVDTTTAKNKRGDMVVVAIGMLPGSGSA